jgi:hypothetical protein
MNERNSPRRLFKLAFLQKCAEAGLTPVETLAAARKAVDALQKESFDLSSVTSPISAGISAVGGLLQPLGNLGMAAAILGPPAVGLGAGYGLAKLQDMDETDVEILRKRRLIEEYRQQAQRLRERTKNNNK